MSRAVSRPSSPDASAPPSRSTGCTAPAPQPDADVDYELTDQTAAPSGDIDSFTWVSYAEPYSLDYAYAFDYADNQVLANVCESLLRLNPDYSLTPGLAESFAHPTPTTWVYTIRDGVTFHDGTPLTADDVVASMSRHLDPAVGSSWYSVYQNVTSIEQTGDREVTVTRHPPDSQFNLAMGGSAGVIESAATLAAAGADYGNSTGGVNCTGPFSLDRVEGGGVASRSPATTTTGTSRCARRSGEVEFLFMNDANARVNALKSGEVDGGWMIPIEAIPQLRELERRRHALRHDARPCRASSSATSRGRSATCACARRCSWHSTARASSTPRPRASAR